MLLIWFIVGLCLGTVLHELGHFVCARLAGFPVQLVSIGTGSIWLRRRYSETIFELRGVLIQGFIRTYPIINQHKGWHSLLLLGGVLGNLTLVIILIALETTQVIPRAGFKAVDGIVVAQYLMIVVNLLPFTAKIDGERLGSDGLQLWRLWSRPAEDARLIYNSFLAKYRHNAVPVTVISPASSRILFHISCMQNSADNAITDESCAALIRELGRKALQPCEEIAVLDVLVTEGLMSDRADLRAQIDTWSSRALDLAPGLPTLEGSRGAVLVMLRHHAHGRALLSRLNFEVQKDPFSALMTKLFLARAEAGLGSFDEAARLMSSARALSTTLPVQTKVKRLQRRIDNEIDAARAGGSH